MLIKNLFSKIFIYTKTKYNMHVVNCHVSILLFLHMLLLLIVL